MKIKLPYGNKLVEVDIPEDNLLTLASPKKIGGVYDAEVEIDRALDNPIGSKRILWISYKLISLSSLQTNQLNP